jgi:hypothetical protein
MGQMHMAGGRERRRGGRGLVAVAVAVVALVAAGSGFMGWSAAIHRDRDGWRELDGDDPPDYVEDAAESRQAARLREKMTSQIETPGLDASEIRRALNLSLPKMPATWRVRDVQVFPTDDGPSVTLVVDTPSGGRLELFAVRANAWRGARPELARRGHETVAFWERGPAAYVLSGSHSQIELLADASVLARSADL